MKCEIHWWNSESELSQPTIPESFADQIHMESLEAEIIQKSNNSPSYCRCSSEIINYFVRVMQRLTENDRAY